MSRRATAGLVLSGALALAAQACAAQPSATPTVAGPTTRLASSPDDAPRPLSACDPSGEAFYVWKETSEQEAATTSLLTLREGGYWQFDSNNPDESASGCLSETVQKRIEKAIAASTLQTSATREACTGQPYALVELTVRGIRLVWADECRGQHPHESVPPLITTVREQVGLR